MTREEAIEKLHWFALDNRDKQIIDMAIEALTSQNPTTPNNTCEVDLIRRADAIELCAEAQGRASTKSELKGISKVWQGLLKLPSAEAETKCIARIKVDTEEVFRRIKEEYDKALYGYAEWLEKIIVEAETFEWLCDDAIDKEWCEKNCDYASIQAKCLRHIYKVSKGGEEYKLATEQMEHDAMYEPTYNPEDGSM